MVASEIWDPLIAVLSFKGIELDHCAKLWVSFSCYKQVIFYCLLCGRCHLTIIEHQQWMVLVQVEILKPLHRQLQVCRCCVALVVDSMQV